MQIKKRVGVLIQARLTSSRLPKKVLLKIKNKSLIEIMYSRIRFSKIFKNIYFIIPDNKKNILLFNFLKNKKIPVMRGDEADVMKRYYIIAKKKKISTIVRLTGDCPLIDYKICEELLKKFQQKKLDYICTGKTYADGLDCEIFSYKSLENAMINYKRNKQEKEHVTYFFKKRKKLFKTLVINKKNNDNKIRITIDYKNDFLLMKKIIEKFSGILKKKYVSSSKIINFLNKNNSIKKLNINYVRQ